MNKTIPPITIGIVIVVATAVATLAMLTSRPGVIRTNQVGPVQHTDYSSTQIDVVDKAPALNIPVPEDANTVSSTASTTDDLVVIWLAQPKPIADLFFDSTLGAFAPMSENQGPFELYAVGQIDEGDFKNYTLYLQIEHGLGTWHNHYLGREVEDKIVDARLIVSPAWDKPFYNTWEIRATIKDLEPPQYIAIPGSQVVLERDSNGLKNLASTYQKNPLFESAGIKVLQSATYGCPLVPRVDGTIASYHFKLDFIGEDNVLDLTYTNGEANTAQYDYLAIYGCGDNCLKYTPLDSMINPDADLELVGQTSQGFSFYQLIDANHPVLEKLFSDPIGSHVINMPDLSYDEFIAQHPLLFWKDPFDRWITFQNRKFLPLAEMCKPIVYLYPTQPMNINVSVKPNGGISVSEPKHGSEGWKVLAQPDGKLTTHDGATYPYLLWEGTGFNYPEPTSWFLVSRNEVSSFFYEKLSYLGLTLNEIEDFNEYWLPRLQGHPYYKITFLDQEVIENLAPLSVHPRPDTVIRVFMDYQGLQAPVSTEEPELMPGQRQGFSVIEWGGAARN